MLASTAPKKVSPIAFNPSIQKSYYMPLLVLSISWPSVILLYLARDCRTQTTPQYTDSDKTQLWAQHFVLCALIPLESFQIR